MIMDQYHVNKETIAFLPARKIEYNSVVIEGGNTYYIKKTPFQLMKAACLAHWSSYEGRRKAVLKKTNYLRKVPIPISITKQIYAFPTHSPTQFDCNWIFFNHILKITKCKDTNDTIVTFKNFRQLRINVSRHSLETQFHRTFHLLHLSINSENHHK